MLGGKPILEPEVVDMRLRIEAASEKLLRSQYPELVADLESNHDDYNIVEEPVGFGPGQDLILVGLVFIWESIASGITWDIVRSQLLRLLGNIERPKSKNVSVYIETDHPKERFEIECKYDNENIDISLPKGLRVRIRQQSRD